MVVFDFDGTLYNGDSSVDFFLYELLHFRIKPIRICFLFLQSIMYFIKAISTKSYKSAFFSFVKDRSDLSRDLLDFWQKHKSRLRQDLVQNHEKEELLIISASPEFLVRPGANLLGISEVIASNISPVTAEFTGENCKGKEKVLQFYAKYPTKSISCFYTDTKSDIPMMELATVSYFVKKHGKNHFVLKPLVKKS